MPEHSPAASGYVTAERLTRSASMCHPERELEKRMTSTPTLLARFTMLRILSARSFILTAAVALVPFALQAQATTMCKDGTTSTAAGKGACSGHGGVDKGTKKAAKADAKASSKVAKADVKADVKADTKMSKSAAKAEKAEDKAASKPAKTASAPAATASKTTAVNTDPTGATAKCKDGTYSHAATHRGACSRHGGVAEWLKT